nr:reverse transcriptase domain-containing protein [Tanacetum cinerariifolium]
MHTRASNSEVVEPLPEPEHILNQKLHRQNRRVPFEQRNEPHAQPKVVYVSILDINYFCHFLDILENYNPMDDEPMWATDRVVTSTLGSVITIPETANEFAIKGNYLTLDKEEDFDAFLDEGSKILHSIEGTILEEKLFAELNEFTKMIANENSESDPETKEPPLEKITFNTDYKIKTSFEEPPSDLELKPLSDNLGYLFLEELSFLPMIISSQLSKQNKNKLISVLKRHKQAFA